MWLSWISCGKFDGSIKEPPQFLSHHRVLRFKTPYAIREDSGCRNIFPVIFQCYQGKVIVSEQWHLSAGQNILLRKKCGQMTHWVCNSHPGNLLTLIELQSCKGAFLLTCTSLFFRFWPESANWRREIYFWAGWWNQDGIDLFYMSSDFSALSRDAQKTALYFFIFFTVLLVALLTTKSVTPEWA